MGCAIEGCYGKRSGESCSCKRQVSKNSSKCQDSCVFLWFMYMDGLEVRIIFSDLLQDCLLEFFFRRFQLIFFFPICYIPSHFSGPQELSPAPFQALPRCWD